MCCISDYRLIMSRAKNRGAVDICGDCGSQGEIRKVLKIFRK